MLFALLDTGVTSIGVDRVFLAVQQFANLSDIGYIRRGAVNAIPAMKSSEIIARVREGVLHTLAVLCRSWLKACWSNST